MGQNYTTVTDETVSKFQHPSTHIAVGLSIIGSSLQTLTYRSLFHREAEETTTSYSLAPSSTH